MCSASFVIIIIIMIIIVAVIYQITQRPFTDNIDRDTFSGNIKDKSHETDITVDSSW